MSLTVDELIEIAERACALAKKHGADAAEAQVQAGGELTTKVRLGKPELVQEAASKALGLRLFRDQRAALTYTSDLSPGALDRFVADSVELARLAEPDELNQLPPKDLLARELPELELWDEQALSTTAADALAICVRAEKAARDFSSKVTNSEGATYSRTAGAGAFATTDGFRGGYRGTYQSLVVEPICDDAGGKKRNGFWWTADRFAARLQDPEEVGREAARRTVAKLGAEKIDTGELPVIFDPESGRAILRLLFNVVSGGAIYRKSSYLLDREGTSVASPLVTIVDDPLIPRGPGSRPYDGDGLGSRKNVVVDAGTLKT
ncbi:MAG TPA: metallopeptidase TldD-related protein, partial [Polyangia bacterium]